MWHVTYDMWHVTYDFWHMVGVENSFKISKLYLQRFGKDCILKIERKGGLTDSKKKLTMKVFV